MMLPFACMQGFKKLYMKCVGKGDACCAAQ